MQPSDQTRHRRRDRCNGSPIRSPISHEKYKSAQASPRVATRNEMEECGTVRAQVSGTLIIDVSGLPALLSDRSLLPDRVVSGRGGRSSWYTVSSRRRSCCPGGSSCCGLEERK